MQDINFNLILSVSCVCSVVYMVNLKTYFNYKMYWIKGFLVCSMVFIITLSKHRYSLDVEQLEALSSFFLSFKKKKKPKTHQHDHFQSSTNV